jgi:hypothetical protein
MKLLTIQLHNFKGIRDFALEPNGESIDVFGDNATGKTTLSDAMHWLLFDKDSTGAKEFGIKTTTPSGEAIHNLDHSVKAVLDIDRATPLTLEKVYSETWTKKRGSATASFTGHTTNYFVDGVPVPLKDYKATIAAIGDEETFRLLTNPAHFNELHWTERRRILLDVCGDISDAEVIESDAKLARITDMLGGRTLDDQRKVLAARRKEINAELERIPVRITEVERGLPEKSSASVRTLDAIDADIAKVREEIARVEAGGEVAEATKRLREAEAKLLVLDSEDQAAVNAARAEADAAASEKRRAVSEARDKLAQLVADRDRFKRTVDENAANITRKRYRMDALRNTWSEEDAEQFEGFTGATSCVACGQNLPAELIQTAADKALANFNHSKAVRLESITEEGRNLKATADEIAGVNESLRASIDELQGDIDAQSVTVQELESASTETQPAPEVPVNPLRASALKAIEATKATIADLQRDIEPKLEALRDKVGDLNSERSAAEQVARDADAIAKGKARVKELAAEEKTLASEYEQLEADLFLTEEFVRAKVELLEGRINSHFELVRFRLFESQINGGLSECCETLVNGVPYSSGLNNAARIAAGLDIIRTLSTHYGLSAPIFIDNAESITDIPAIGTQVIALYVSEPDKSLRVERTAS